MRLKMPATVVMLAKYSNKEINASNREEQCDKSRKILNDCFKNWKYMTMEELENGVNSIKKVFPDLYDHLANIIERYKGKNYNYTYLKRALDNIPSSISGGIPTEFAWGLSVALSKSK